MTKRLHVIPVLLVSLLMAAMPLQAQKRGTEFHAGMRSEPVKTIPQRTRPASKTVTPDIVSFTRTQTSRPGKIERPLDSAIVKAPPAPRRALGDSTTIYGSLSYSNEWTTYQSGIYNFHATSKLNSTKVFNLSHQANGGGTLIGSKFFYQYFIYTQEMGFTFADLCTYDIKTGAETRKTQIYPDQSQVTYSLAWDPVKKKLFALSYAPKFIDEDSLIQRYAPSLSVVDTITGRVTSIAELPKMSFLAINPGGEAFAASTGVDSRLYRINTATGAYSEVGPTGISPANYTQAATFDPVTGKLYWAATHLDGSSALYEVNTSTGAASKIGDFPHDEEYTGLYILTPDVADGAPASVSNVQANFSNGSLTGTITATTPSKTANGSNLSGNVTVKLIVDHGSETTQTVSPNGSVSFPLTLTEGVHSFELIPSNSVGEGVRYNISKYIGIDAPVAVSKLTLSPDSDGKAHLTWTAPTIGIHDGYVDPSQLSYTITRQPDGTVVATGLKANEYVEEVTAPVDRYYYEVTSYCGNLKGFTATSNKHTFGSGSELPYTYEFNSLDEFNLWTVIDANHDFNDLRYGKWQYGADLKLTGDESHAAVYKWSSGKADDWLISPPFTVIGGRTYRVSYLVKTRGSEETFQVTAGNLNTVAAQTAITNNISLKNTNYTLRTAEFTPAASGNYFVGFHALSKANAYYLFIDSVSIDIVPETNTPAAVEGLTVTADPDGSLSATISFTAPTKRIDGSALSSLTSINVYHGDDNTVVHSFSNPAPGAQLSFVEEVPHLGLYNYRIVASNASGAGEKAQTSVYIGPDLAEAVNDLTLNIDSRYPVVTWTAPTKGQNGGYVNASKLTYRIVRLSDGRVLNTRYSGTSFTDNTLDGNQSQYYVAYEVAPVSAAGEGADTSTVWEVFGKPYTNGLSESFPNATTETTPWTIDPVKDNKWKLHYNGEYPSCNPVDNDGGLVVFKGSEASAYSAMRLVSPKLDIKNFIVPVLRFCVYHYSPDTYEDPDYADDDTYMTPEIRKPDGTYVTVGDRIRVSNGYNGWVRYTIPLTDYKDLDYVQISFKGEGMMGEYDMAMDAITVTNENDYDLSAYSFAGPTKVNAGRDAKYILEIQNVGMSKATGYSVDLLRDGNVVQTKQGADIEHGKFATVDFTVSTTEADNGKTLNYSTRINFASDRNVDNNTSRTVTTNVIAPLYPEVYSLKAQKVNSDSAFVFWDTPDAIHFLDDFETYPAWSASAVGNYTLYDGDKTDTYGFADLNFPGNYDPKSFIVFNPDALGASKLPEWKAYSGSQLMASFASYSGTNDDWLISPPVYGGDSISFVAKTAGNMGPAYGYETFEVLYSAVDTAIANFVNLSGTVTTTDNWQRYSYLLPEAAKYFAIRCTSKNAYVFYLDDLSYTERVNSSNFNVTGYNVYRNGLLVATLPAGQTNFFDADLPEGIYNYTVSAEFSGGESAQSPVATVVIGNPTTGIDGISTDDVSRNAGTVYTTSGQLVGRDAFSSSLPRGVYIVGGKKIVIK